MRPMTDSAVPDYNAPLAANSTLFHSPRTFIYARIQRSIGPWGPDDSLPHGKAQSCKFPQEYWFGTFWKSNRCRVITGPLVMRHLNDVSLVGRWWPVLVTGYRLIYLIISCL